MLGASAERRVVRGVSLGTERARHGASVPNEQQRLQTE